jgi:hypothetical protein
MRIIARLLTVGGAPNKLEATFGLCNSNGEPHPSGTSFIVPIQTEAAARELGAKLYETFAITIFDIAVDAPPAAPARSGDEPLTTWIAGDVVGAAPKPPRF